MVLKVLTLAIKEVYCSGYAKFLTETRRIPRIGEARMEKPMCRVLNLSRSAASNKKGQYVFVPIKNDKRIKEFSRVHHGYFSYGFHIRHMCVEYVQFIGKEYDT